MLAQEVDVAKGQEKATGTGRTAPLSNASSTSNRGLETSNRPKLHRSGKVMVLKSYERGL